VVRVDASSSEGWFYEGAGIYRHSWLIKQPLVHIPLYGTYITTKVSGKSATVNVETEIFNQDIKDADCRLELQVVDESGKIVKP
jgi:beta-galactosidase